VGTSTFRRSGTAVLVAVLSVTSATAQTRPTSSGATPASQVAAPAPETPASLGRIRAALEQAPQNVLKMPETPEFNIVIEGRLPRFEDFVTAGELTSYAMPTSMTHSEYLAMVTPAEARPFASSVNGDLVQVIATSVATSLALTAIAQALKSAFRSRKEEEAKKEVEPLVEELKRRQSEGTSPAPPPVPLP
jgi:hypothetical protein